MDMPVGLLVLKPSGPGNSTKENEPNMEPGRCAKLDCMEGPFSKTLFVSDLDGTLLTSQRGLVKGQASTLNRLIDQGLQFTVATARSIQAINVLLKDVHLALPAITLGGSLVTRPESGEHLLARVLSHSTAEGILTRLLRRGLFPFIVSIDGHRDRAFHSHTASAAAEWYVDEKKAYGDPRLSWYDHPSEVLGTEILEMTTFVEQEGLNELMEDMLQVDGAAVSAIPARQSPGWYEVAASHPQADKGTGVDGLCQALDSRWDRIVAFGDEVNDLPLFERAEYSIAVQNAAPEVLARANEVIGSNDSGAVIDYLVRHFDQHTKL